uniref:Uncharacterized protein n=1 Tax=Anguilla anguilla TaxID=7936 RepID=A0A0E9RGA8_ANGAN
MVILVPLGPLGPLSALKSETSAAMGFMSLGERNVCLQENVSKRLQKSFGQSSVDCFIPGQYLLKSLFLSS